MNEDNKQWKEIELPPLKVANLGQPESSFTRKCSIDIYATKFIMEDEDGNRRIKFHDNEIVFIDSSYLLELLPK